MSRSHTWPPSPFVDRDAPPGRGYSPSDRTLEQHPVLARLLAQSDQETLATRSFELGLEAFIRGLGEPSG